MGQYSLLKDEEINFNFGGVIVPIRFKERKRARRSYLIANKNHFIVVLRSKHHFPNIVYRRYVYVFDKLFNMQKRWKEELREYKETFKKMTLQDLKRISKKTVLQHKKIYGYKIEPNVILVKSKENIGYYQRNTVYVNIDLAMERYNEEMFRYILIHELTHRFFHEHTQGFWEEVKKFYPDFGYYEAMTQYINDYWKVV